VAVVGSANLDVVVAVDRFPGPGETVLGGEVQEIAGGKGLNQAVAAARTAPPALVGCVGDDDAGRLLLARAAASGVDVQHVRRVDAPTGRAFIQVAADGENSIVVAAGANSAMTAVDVERALDQLRPSVVLAQLEVPLEAVEAAAVWARRHDARFVLNPSPMRDLPSSLVGLCDSLVVNVTEATQLLGAAPEAAHALARALAGLTASAVVTDGPRGAYVGAADGVTHCAVLPVDAVDTTGAGDEFAGRLVASLAQGLTLAEATADAAQSAAHLVSLPRSAR